MSIFRLFPLIVIQLLIALASKNLCNWRIYHLDGLMAYKSWSNFPTTSSKVCFHPVTTLFSGSWQLFFASGTPTKFLGLHSQVRVYQATPIFSHTLSNTAWPLHLLPTILILPLIPYASSQWECLILSLPCIQSIPSLWVTYTLPEFFPQDSIFPCYPS